MKRYIFFSFNTQSLRKPCKNGSQARSADLVHTHNGEKVSKVMFKSTFDLPFTFSRGRYMAKTFLLVPGLKYGLFKLKNGNFEAY